MAAYNFGRPTSGGGVFVLKGVDERAKELISRLTKKNKHGITRFTTGRRDREGSRLP